MRQSATKYIATVSATSVSRAPLPCFFTILSHFLPLAKGQTDFLREQLHKFIRGDAMKIKVAPGTLLLMLLLCLGGGKEFPATLLAALFHELGHLAAAKLLGIRIAQMEIDVLGAKLYPAGLLPSFGDELCLAASGPLFSLLLSAFLFPYGGLFARTLALTSLSLALFNLLPIGEFDGGRMLHAALSCILDAPAAHRVLAACTYLSLLLLFCLSSCLLLRYGQNLSLAVLTATLFAKFFLTH